MYLLIGQRDARIPPFPVLQTPSARPVANRASASGHRLHRVVASELDGVRTFGLRFGFLCAGGGRAQWTRFAHGNLGFARGADRDVIVPRICLREGGVETPRRRI